MAAVMDRGTGTRVRRGRPKAARPSLLSITLADLITATQDVVGPEDDGLVVATVRHLLRSGQLTGRGSRRVAQRMISSPSRRGRSLAPRAMADHAGADG